MKRLQGVGENRSDLKTKLSPQAGVGDLLAKVSPRYFQGLEGPWSQMTSA